MRFERLNGLNALFAALCLLPACPELVAGLPAGRRPGSARPGLKAPAGNFWICFGY